MEKPQTWFAYCDIKNTSTTVKLQMCFFVVAYFCLLIITTNAIIKANVMIVTPINE